MPRTSVPTPASRAAQRRKPRRPNRRPSVGAVPPPPEAAAPNPIAAGLPAAATGPGGRALAFNPNLAAHILERLADGETLSAILAADGMPTRRTWNNWLLAIADLRALHIEARKQKAHALFDEALDIARKLKHEHTKLEGSDVAALRVAIETLKWAASKLLPSEYGERPPAMPTVAIQINTGLDLGGLAKVDTADDGATYSVRVGMMPPEGLGAGSKASAQDAGRSSPARRGHAYLRKPKYDDPEWSGEDPEAT